MDTNTNTNTNTLKENPPSSAKEIFSNQEIKELVRSSNWAGVKAVGTTWVMIIGSMGLVACYPNVFTILFSLIILGGRHLALGILMHDASHGSLFRDKGLNDFIGKWLCAYPTWQDLHRYREHHLRHHLYAGTEQDPDLELSAPFPVSKKSLLRKIFRDLIGLSGIKRIYGLLLMDFGFIEYTVAGGVKRIPQNGRTYIDVLKTGGKNLHGVFITNLILWAILYSMNLGWIYGLWFLAYLIPFSVFVRIRSIAEHACLVKSLNPLLNTRSTKASWLARITVAPHRVNFHLEHHLLMKAPYFRLPQIHKILKDRKLLNTVNAANSYVEVLKSAVSLKS